MKTGTLKELNVRPGDVVEVIGGKSWEIVGIDGRGNYLINDPPACHLSNTLPFRIISRATDTPKLWRDMTDEEKANVPADVLDDPTNPLRMPWCEWRKAMKIEVGDVVELNNGEVHKVDRMLGGDPDHVDDHGHGPFVIDGVGFHKDGSFSVFGFAHPASVKRIISRAPDDTPKFWRDMTEEERANVPADVLNDPTNPLRIPWGEWSGAAKGAVLLAHHEGEVIEVLEIDNDGPPWPKLSYRPWISTVAYRVKPEFVRETVTLMIDDGSMGGPRAIGTIDLIDGGPDCDSIKIGED